MINFLCSWSASRPSWLGKGLKRRRPGYKYNWWKGTNEWMRFLSVSVAYYVNIYMLHSILSLTYDLKHIILSMLHTMIVKQSHPYQYMIQHTSDIKPWWWEKVKEQHIWISIPANAVTCRHAAIVATPKPFKTPGNINRQLVIIHGRIPDHTRHVVHCCTGTLVQYCCALKPVIMHGRISVCTRRVVHSTVYSRQYLFNSIFCILGW